MGPPATSSTTARALPDSSSSGSRRSRALQRIALGQEATATARDQLAALKELLKLGFRGTTSYLERPGEADLTRRAHAIHEAKRRRDLERQEQSFGTAD
jgi:hypothetical protein